MKINALTAKIFVTGAIFGISFLNPGYKKDKIDADPMSMLTAKEWTLSKNDTDAKLGENYQYYPWAECFFDDKWKFEKNETYKITYGKVKCSDDEPKDLSGSYRINFNKRKY